jgi:hypothetical protein
MELHTLGVHGGYTQDDVTSLARIITGWTFAGRDGSCAPGTFAFNVNAHEPGPQKLLGKIYEDTGVAQGEAALADIARHPATAGSSPPSSYATSLPTIRRLRWWRSSRAAFRKTNGDLRAMTLALVDADEAWRAPMTKIRMPYEYLVASGRMMGRIPGRSAALSRRAECAWSATMGARRAERLCRHQRGMGRAGKHQVASRHCLADFVAHRRQYRSARAARCGGRGSGLGRDASDHRSRGIQAAGLCAAADVARIQRR